MISPECSFGCEKIVLGYCYKLLTTPTIIDVYLCPRKTGDHTKKLDVLRKKRSERLTHRRSRILINPTISVSSQAHHHLLILTLSTNQLGLLLLRHWAPLSITMT